MELVLLLTERILLPTSPPQLPFKTFSLKLPLRQGMRCSNQEAHRSLIFRLNLHIRKGLVAAAAAAGGAGPASGTGRGHGGAVDTEEGSATNRVIRPARALMGDADLSICRPHAAAEHQGGGSSNP